MPKLKDFLKNLNFVSQCCNHTYDDDDEWREYLLKRVEKLETDFEKCTQHQEKLRNEIMSLLAHLARMNGSTDSSTALLREDKYSSQHQQPPCHT